MTNKIKTFFHSYFFITSFLSLILGVIIPLFIESEKWFNLQLSEHNVHFFDNHAEIRFQCVLSISFFIFLHILNLGFKFYLDIKNDLDGFWIYGFNVENQNVNSLVIGSFELKHKISGLNVKHKGQSEDITLINEIIHTKERGTWTPLAIFYDNQKEELWILYNFKFTAVRGDYEGSIHLSNTKESIDLPTKKYKLFNRSHSTFVYTATVKHISDDDNINTFRNSFAFKCPPDVTSKNKVKKFIQDNWEEINKLYKK